jgi:ubiquinone/menaquinone biosynthesis C-methylase UbiE
MEICKTMATKLFKQTWWDNNLNNSKKFGEYLGWLEDKDASSRVFIRENIKDLEIKSIADFGCGPCVDYIALNDEGYDFDYLGIDSCIHLKEFNESKEINFLNAPVEKTGLEENSYEMSYSRHLLEHLPTYKDALKEMIRVASKYVVHIFFIKPSEEEKINYWEDENLYHNQYCQTDIETYLKKNKKVTSFEWIDVNEKETALVINLN